jgi:DNA replication protein DnaD
MVFCNEEGGEEDMGIADVITQLNNYEFQPKKPPSIADMIEQLDETPKHLELSKELVLNYPKIGLKPNEWSFFCLIETLQSDNKEIPNQVELAKMMDMTPRNIQIIISELKAKGLLKTKVIRKENKTIYDFSVLKERAAAISKSINTIHR